ncbi:MAG: hypothetical protein KatS3mg113_0690 [Planctomycetaceae bacterium]|nr:MAG: hypothetical protein KatS3mg113_0690 [Planctomycetaceae bacterium]
MDQAWILWVSSAMAAYFAGSLPFSWLLARWLKGVDLRQVGSGNIGATNASRVLGARWGGIALLLDAMKGLLPTWGCPWIWSEQAVGVQTLRVWCGIWAILGHTFPIWLGFRGGKGGSDHSRGGHDFSSVGHAVGCVSVCDQFWPEADCLSQFTGGGNGILSGSTLAALPAVVAT